MQDNIKPTQSLGFIMGRAGKAMKRALTDRFRQAGLSLSVDQFIVLAHLGAEDGQSQLQLREEAGHDKTSVSRAIDRLVKENMVVRVPDQQDRRHKRVYLTQLGKDMIESVQGLLKDQLHEAKQDISTADMEACKRVLTKVYLNLKHYI